MRERLFTRYYLLLFLLFAILAGRAQLPEYHLQQFDYSSGIRAGGIIGLTKDSSGFVWILYPRGIQRFDGRQVTEFKPGSDLRYVFCDTSGRIWVNSFKGIFSFDTKTQSFRKINVRSRDETNDLGNLFNLPDGGLLLSSREGLFRFDPSLSEFVPADKKLPVAPPYGVRFFSCYGNSIFFSKPGFLYRCNLATSQADSLPDISARAIYAISEDSAVVTSWNLGSYWFNFSQHRSSMIEVPADREPNSNTGLKNFGIRALVKISNQQFLLASTHGLFQYSSNSRTFLPLVVYDKGRQVRTAEITSYLYADHDNYVWMTTADGISRFPTEGQSFGLVRMGLLNYNLPPAVDNIRGITSDGKDNFWLATASGFVNWNRKQNTFSIYMAEEGSTTKLAFNSLRGIAYDGRYVILGPTNFGLWLFDPVTKKYRRPLYDSLSTQTLSDQDFVDAILTLKSGDHVITGRDAVYVLDGKTYMLRRAYSEADSENPNFCFQTSDGFVWLTTIHGLHLFDEHMHYIQRVHLPGTRTQLTAGFTTNDGQFLFSLNNGLYTATSKGGEVRVVKKSTVFDNIYIASLFQDSKGVIWASSDYGIYRYDTLHRSLNLYDYTDNIQGYGFNLNTTYKAADGTLFFGGINGLNYLNPSQLPGLREGLRVYISALKLYNDSLVYDLSPRKFSYDQRSFEVRFSAPYYNNAAKVQYRYRLSGLDQEWKDLGNNHQLRFTDLPSGQYLLEVQASVNQTDWVDASNDFSFTIRPPFWLTWWFISLCVAALVGAVWLLLDNRHRRLRKQREELEVDQAINFFSSSMYSQQSVDQLLWDVAKNCIGRLHFEDCVIYRVDEDGQRLYQVAAFGDKSPDAFVIADPIEIAVGSGITGAVAATARPVIVKDTRLDDRYIVDGKRRLSEIAVPIMMDGQVFGVIDCEHSTKGFFTQKHLNMLQTISNLCAGKIVKITAEAERSAAEKSLMETKQKMAEVEMQALRAQMNPHFIFNCLNSINRYILKSDQATASLYLTRFAKLIRLILDNSNSSYITLANELDALKLYIEMESIRFEKQFTYSIITDTNVIPDQLYVPPLIIQPYVENSIWHGLLHKETSGHLSIHVSVPAEGVMQCVVEDNGVGREKARELKSKSTSTKKSLGMKLTEDRLALLNKQAKGESSVEIEDLYDENGMASGTRVIIRLLIEK